MESKGNNNNNLFKLYAKKYWEFGTNVTCINNYPTEFNFDQTNILKSPSHEWKNLILERQNNEDFQNFDWNNAVGVGAILGYKNVPGDLGYNKLIALDLDGCFDYSFVAELLIKIGLPENYEWVIKTGSKSGFSIIIEDESAFPNRFGLVYDSIDNRCKKIEVLLKTHIVLPPSIHPSGLNYEFNNCNFPSKKPQLIIKNSLFDFLYDKCITSVGNLSPYASGYVCPDTTNFLDAEKFDNEIYLNKLSNYDKHAIKSGREPEPIFFMVIDIETDGLLDSKNNYPNILQISWQIINPNSAFLLKRKSYLIKNENILSNKAYEINKISIEVSNEFGGKFKDILKELGADMFFVKGIIAHNIEFDIPIIEHYFKIYGINNSLDRVEKICTMKSSVSLTPSGKYLSLKELFKILYKFEVYDQHNSEVDVMMTNFCYAKLVEMKLIN